MRCGWSVDIRMTTIAGFEGRYCIKDGKKALRTDAD
jgi:hypothetical protein